MASRPDPPSERPGIFGKTVWAEVTHGPRATDAQRAQAQGEFYRIYWRPVFLLVCRRGFAVAEAEDMAEEFLLHFLRSGALSRAQPAKGRLRDFIVAALDHYLINRRAQAAAEKRGGKFLHVGLDDPEVGQLRAAIEEAPDENILSSLRQALQKLETQYARKGRLRLFRILKEALLQPGQAGYAQLASSLHCSPATLRSDAKRFREKLRKLLRAARKPNQPARVK